MAKLDKETRDALPAREFAFPTQRKEPLEDAHHVRNAIARFIEPAGAVKGSQQQKMLGVDCNARMETFKIAAADAIIR